MIPLWVLLVTPILTPPPDALPGGSSETPQLQGKLAYEGDLWGKAPFYGRPRGFVAQLTGGWQRTRYQRNTAVAEHFWPKCLWRHRHEPNRPAYLDPWGVQGTLFIPVLPTYSNNLAGSAFVTAQYYVGQGVFSFLGDQDRTTPILIFREFSIITPPTI